MTLEWFLIGLGVVLWVFSILLLGLICGLTDDEAPRRPLERRPNIRLVPRDEKDAAA